MIIYYYYHQSLLKGRWLKKVVNVARLQHDNEFKTCKSYRRRELSGLFCLRSPGCSCLPGEAPCPPCGAHGLSAVSAGSRVNLSLSPRRATGQGLLTCPRHRHRLMPHPRSHAATPTRGPCAWSTTRADAVRCARGGTSGPALCATGEGAQERDRVRGAWLSTQ